ncbi:disease resistance protein RPM1-like [Curcuma longa]|uniref:disease resistance protein RPM1-like n=1 Tax=Curcuma longa TaxID=136217 RepID=UPI003D9EBF55
MVGVLISFLLDKISGIVVDQAQRTSPLGQIHCRIDRITAELKVMKAFLEGSNWSPIAPAANKPLDAWIQQMRAVAFEVEDIIDDYLHLVGEQRERTWKDHLSRPSNLRCNLAKVWHGIDSRLEVTEKKMLNLLDTRAGFDLTLSGNEDRIDSQKGMHHYHAYSLMLIDEDDLVGTEEKKSKLLSWLTNADTCSERRTIVIWGIGCQEKTTLVEDVYHNNTVKSHFDCQVWITVSQNYSVEEILRTIIQEIFEGKKEPAPNGITTMQRSNLEDIIEESLWRKRYLVVLDDVWHEDLWYQIRWNFVDRDNGSRFIITTRKPGVARIASKEASDEDIMELQQLDAEDAWILFCKKAFRRENNKDCPEELENYARRIMDECQGSPLAIALIGSLLSFKEKSEIEWNEVYDCLCRELRNNSLSDEGSIVNLCFNDLPCNLKNCFAYCSIFPDGHLIKRKKLIRLWVAEGFMEAKSSNRVMEEEAEHYLSELVDRSMLQVVERNSFGRLKAFRMQDDIREVTLEISKKMRFSMILDDSQSVLDNSTHRLSIQTNDESLDLHTSLSQLRSLVAFSTSKFISGSLKEVFMSFKMLRVLELEDVPISNLPNEVSVLFNLHYLGLRKTRVEQLPNNIQKLQSLQTLDLRDSRINKLPQGVTQLKQLRHLLVSGIEVEFGGTVLGCFPTLEGACQWKNLQTLRSIKATKKLVQLLGDMKELRSLQVVEVEQAHCLQLCTSLTKMRNLRCLRLSARSEEQLNFEMLNSPPPLLQKLDLWGRLFGGKMPTFIYSCAELVRVRLLWSQLIEDPLPSLRQLDKLVVLILGPGAYEGQRLHFRTDWFCDLKRLYLGGLKNLNSIVIEKGAMASLHELVMTALPELKMVRGIKLLTLLQSLSLFGMPEELMVKLRKDMYFLMQINDEKIYEKKKEAVSSEKKDDDDDFMGLKVTDYEFHPQLIYKSMKDL